MKILVTGLLLFAISTMSFNAFAQSDTEPSNIAALAVFIGEHQIDFSHPDFQNTHKSISFEDGNPYVVHINEQGVPLKTLFNSMELQITPNCIVIMELPTEFGQFCSDENQTLMFFVNGEVHSYIDNYKMQSNDRVLITLSDDNSAQKQLEYLDSLEISDKPKKLYQSYINA